MTETILEKKYVDPNRPYSHKEIQSIRMHFFSYLRIGNTRIEHPDCGHFYYAKKGGRKERESMTTNSKNIGKCSVCWKLYHTPPRFLHLAENMVHTYSEYFYEEPEHWLHYDYYMEKTFYTWLYKEFNPDKREHK